MSSLRRMLGVLELFTPEAPSWTAEDIAEVLDCSVTTAYRYVRELVEVGLLRRDQGATYVLGTLPVELDYQIRMGDPFILAAGSVVEALAKDMGYDTVVGTFYGDRIVTVLHAVGSEPAGASYGRGRRMPMFRGALSKCIVCMLPRAQLRKIHARQLASDPSSPSWDELLAEVQAVRKAGFAVTLGELDPNLVGVAVPLVSAAHRISASLGFVVS